MSVKTRQLMDFKRDFHGNFISTELLTMNTHSALQTGLLS